MRMCNEVISLWRVICVENLGRCVSQTLNSLRVIKLLSLTPILSICRCLILGLFFALNLKIDKPVFKLRRVQGPDLES